MAQLRCPKCQTVFEIEDNSTPGSPVTCTGCGVQMKVPAAPRAASGRRAPAVNNRMTPIFRQMANAKVVPGKVQVKAHTRDGRPEDTAKFIGVGVGVIALIVLAVMFFNKSEPPRKTPAPAPIYTPPPESPPPSPSPTPTETQAPYVSPTTPPTSTPVPTETPKLLPSDASQVKWQKIADDLKSGGQRYKDETRPEYAPMLTLQRISKKAAIEGLLPFFDDEDPAYARAINDALSYLTGEKYGKATPATKAEIKKKWAELAASLPSE